MTDNPTLSDTTAPTDEVEVVEKDHMFAPFLGGATSLSGAFDFLEAKDEQRKVDDLMWLFRDVQDNIFTSPEMQLPEKVSAMGELIEEFSAELAQVKEKTLFIKVKNAIFPLHREEPVEEKVEGVRLFRNKENNVLQFVAIASNNFKDHDSPPDIITKAAHEEYVEWVTKTGHYPELRLWHLPDTRLGQVTWVEEVNGFLVTGGIIDEDSESLALKAVNEHSFNAISMGFIPVEEEAHVIEKYRTFEVSILPEEHAANPWTSIDLL